MHARKLSAIRIAALAFLMLVAAGASAVEKWNFATPYNEKEYLTINDQAFIKDLADSTKGAIEVTMHANASLFKLPEIKRAVQTRQVAIGEVFLSAWANEDPIYAVQTLPFLVANIKETRPLWNVHKPYVAARLEKQGLHLLYGAIWPGQSLFTKREVDSLKGLSGVKFRVQNPSTARIAELMGVTGVRVETADIPQAFLTGTVDAMFTSNVTTANSAGWDYLKYSYSTNAWYPLNIIFINKAVFDRLEPALQKAVTEAAARAEDRVWSMESAETAAKDKQLREKGITIVDPAPAKMMSEFREVGQTMMKEWLQSAGADGQKVINEFQAAKGK